MSKLSKTRLREIHNAAKNRRELIAAGLSRRDMLKLGLITSAGYLVTKNGLSAWAQSGSGGNDEIGECQPGRSPPIQPFIDPLFIPPILPQRQLSELTPAPQEFPNHAINPATGMPFEGRGQFNGVLREGTDAFQFFRRFLPKQHFITRQRQNSRARITSDPSIPDQTIWGFNLGGTDPAMSPGPTIVSRYQSPILVRRFNELPLGPGANGFGVPETSTHLHNFHSGPESDGGPCRWMFSGQYYDHYHTMQQAGFDSTHPPFGDINESLSTLWYHDHRIDHTAENAYKGLFGFHLIFNDFDTGDETTGFRLPSFPQFDIPMVLTDKLIDPLTGQVCFDTFGLDGIVGDVFGVNGRVQPFFEAQQRRYRFRILDAGPSRFYELFLTDPENLSQRIPFWVIANDGNLLPRPVQVTSIRLGVAERYDIIIDFAEIARTFGASVLHLENRLEQNNGRGPTGKLLPAGGGNPLVQFRLVDSPARDESVDPATGPRFYTVPSNSSNDPAAQPRITRDFRFERRNGAWAVNQRFVSCDEIRFTVEKNSIERWFFRNNSGGWQHPTHIHLEEFQFLSKNGRPAPPTDRGRKDVNRLEFGSVNELFFRFRDFVGDYVIHCHNFVHEDTAMMLLWEVQDVGDNRTRP
ncbi:MAG: multicopper oxidase domain-containing protein [Verrucomicrobiales bacterium]|nr:multicopper oxidase domain-containing protein [Verrucomicrobiales bacterium]